MKKFKKALVLFLCAVLLVAGSVAGTLAYLQSQTEVANNTFTVGDVKIYLDETDIDGSETKYGYDKLLNAGRDLYNNYTGDYKLIPGRTVTKDPTVWVEENSEPAYVRMIVTVEGYDQLVSALDPSFMSGDMVLLEKLVSWNSTTWASTKFTKVDADTATYEFRYIPNSGIYTATDLAGEYNRLPALFESITVPSSMNNDNLAKLANVSISVVAHAIQSEGFDTAADAWAAFIVS